jgi:alkylation response protein AidB-like acyl-CoA dehydrogenase
MNLDVSPQEKRFREEVRDWLDANVPRGPRPLDGMAARDFDLAWQARQYEAGWAGICWPAEYGGRGLSLIEQIIWYEEYARSGAPYIGTCFVGINHAGPTLIARGSEAQKRFHLRQILKGEVAWCQGFSEPGAGSDLAGLRTEGRVEGDELIVNGAKIWTSYAERVDYQELLLRTQRGSKRHAGLSWVICDMHAPGITIRPIRLMSGAVDLCQVFYDNVRLPLSNLVGQLNDGWSVAMSTLGFERGTGFIADQVKLGQSVERMIAYARENADEDGRTLIRNDRIADMLAELRAEVSALRSMTYASVSRLAAGEVPGARASIVRLCASELSQKVSRAEVELLGATIAEFRYGDKGGLHDYLYSFAQTIAGGSAQIQRNIIGERLLNLPRDR